MRITIYGLYDPANPKSIRYVGQTSMPDVRLNEHRSGHDPVTRQWVDDVRSAGRQINLCVLEVTDRKTALLRESAWIRDCPDAINRPRTFKESTPEFKLPIIPLPDFVAAYIAWSIDRCDGNILQAAKRLGVSRQTLYNKLRILNEQPTPISTPIENPQLQT